MINARYHSALVVQCGILRVLLVLPWAPDLPWYYIFHCNQVIFACPPLILLIIAHYELICHCNRVWTILSIIFCRLSINRSIRFRLNLLDFLVLHSDRSFHIYRFCRVISCLRPRFCIQNWFKLFRTDLSLLIFAWRFLFALLLLLVWISLKIWWPWVLIVLLAKHLLTVLSGLIVCIKFSWVTALDESTEDPFSRFSCGLTWSCEIFIVADSLFYCWLITTRGKNLIFCCTDLLSHFSRLLLEVLFLLLKFEDWDRHIGCWLRIFIFTGWRRSESSCFINLPWLPLWSLNRWLWCIFVKRLFLVCLIRFNDIQELCLDFLWSHIDLSLVLSDLCLFSDLFIDLILSCELIISGFCLLISDIVGRLCLDLVNLLDKDSIIQITN